LKVLEDKIKETDAGVHLVEIQVRDGVQRKREDYPTFKFKVTVIYTSKAKEEAIRTADEANVLKKLEERLASGEGLAAAEQLRLDQLAKIK